MYRYSYRIFSWNFCNSLLSLPFGVKHSLPSHWVSTLKAGNAQLRKIFITFRNILVFLMYHQTSFERRTWWLYNNDITLALKWYTICSKFMLLVATTTYLYKVSISNIFLLHQVDEKILLKISTNSLLSIQKYLNKKY